MSKFKVGDKVRVKTFLVRPCLWNAAGKMDKWMGKIVTIRLCLSNSSYSIAEEPRWIFREDDFDSEVLREFIVIRRDGSDVIASHKRGDEIVKTAKAKCAPSDEFNFETGAKLAFDRLVGREEPKPKTAATAPKFKVGDRVMHIVSGAGTIERVVQVMCVTIYLIKLDTGSFVSAFEHLLSPAPAPQPASKFKVGDRVACDYGEGVLEKIDFSFAPKVPYGIKCKSGWFHWAAERELSPAPESKYYTGKVFAVRTSSDFCGNEITNRRNGHVFEIKDGYLVKDYSEYGVTNTSIPFKSFFDFCNSHFCTEWQEVKE